MNVGGTRLVATVRGHVQGVGFRWYVQREAARLGLDGWVANRQDGSVEVVAEGSDTTLSELVLLLWEGPAGASVIGVDARHEPARGNIVGFTIRSGAHRGD
ncbi:MAG: acylphosphatase [Candidatus Limnocylindrales bacterium]